MTRPEDWQREPALSPDLGRLLDDAGVRTVTAAWPPHAGASPPPPHRCDGGLCAWIGRALALDATVHVTPKGGGRIIFRPLAPDVARMRAAARARGATATTLGWTPPPLTRRADLAPPLPPRFTRPG